MIFKKRTSSSAEYPRLLEYLQAGILVRFNISETTSEDQITSYLYDEFWFPENSTAQEIETFLAAQGYDFGNEYKELIR